VPLCAPLFAALCVGPFLGWKRAELGPALMQLRVAFLVAVVAALVAAVAIDSRSTLAALAFGFGVWLIAGSLSEFASRLRLGRAPLAESMRRLRAMPRAALGMTISHTALGFVVLGSVATGAWHLEAMQTLKPGETMRIAGYDVMLQRVDNLQGPNYIASAPRFPSRPAVGPSRPCSPSAGCSPCSAARSPRPPIQNQRPARPICHPGRRPIPTPAG